MLRLSDESSTLDAQALHRVFDPYSGSEPDPLGLAIAYGIVKQSGGEIFVCTTLSSGSHFEAYLPKASPERVGAERPPSRFPGTRANETVLLVEDDPQVRQLLRTLLERAGYSVIESQANETGALRAIAAGRRIHAVVAELRGAALDGQRIAALLQEMDARIVVLLTGSPSETGDVVLVNEATALVTKPFDSREILDQLRRLLDQRDRPSRELDLTAENLLRGHLEQLVGKDPRLQRELAQGYLSQSERQLTGLLAAASAGDAPVVAICAEELRSTSAVFGADEMVVICREVADQARSGRVASEQLPALQDAHRDLAEALRPIAAASLPAVHG
jgi:DNA-binding response OmpR family regulator